MVRARTQASSRSTRLQPPRPARRPKGAAPTPSDAHTRAPANAGVASLVTSDVVFATSGSRQAVGLDLVDTVAADYRVHVKPGPADPGPAKSRSRSESARRSAPGLRGFRYSAVGSGVTSDSRASTCAQPALRRGTESGMEMLVDERKQVGRAAGSGRPKTLARAPRSGRGCPMFVNSSDWRRPQIVVCLRCGDAPMRRRLPGRGRPIPGEQLAGRAIVGQYGEPDGASRRGWVAACGCGLGVEVRRA